MNNHIANILISSTVGIFFLVLLLGIPQSSWAQSGVSSANPERCWCDPPPAVARPDGSGGSSPDASGRGGRRPRDGGGGRGDGSGGGRRDVEAARVGPGGDGGAQSKCFGGVPKVTIDGDSFLCPGVPAPYTFKATPSGGSSLWSNSSTADTIFRTITLPDTIFVAYTTSPTCTAHDTLIIFPTGSSISGNAFADGGGDGMKDFTDPDFPGVPIFLIDTNFIIHDFTFTDANGNYTFNCIGPGSYFVKCDSLPPNHVLTAPGGDSQFDPVSRTNFNPIVIDGINTVNGIDVGLWPQNPGQIIARLWVDSNFNGIQDLGEPGIAHLPVSIEEIGGSLPNWVLTDSAGFLVFKFLPPGNFILKVDDEDIPDTVTPGFPVWSPPDQGGDDNVDSDFFQGPIFGGGTGAQTFPIPINPGANVPNIGGGIQPDTSVKIKIITIISGADRGNGEMGTELVQGGFLPTSEPYSGLGYGLTEGIGITLGVDSSIADCVVDWVNVELRDKNDSTMIIASKAAVVLKDGTVLDPNGKTLSFNVPQGIYFIAVRHRNSLDIMTAHPQFLDDQDFTVDFTDPNTATTGVDAQQTLGDGRFGLWEGDASGDNELKYSGSGNDRGPILFQNGSGGTDPTATDSGYFLEDTNLDGIIKYSGPDNDRAAILLNIGGTDPTKTKKSGLPD